MDAAAVVAGNSGESPGHLSSHGNADRRRLAALCLAALGVVYGDIGTSPLYAVRECFYGTYGVAVDPANVFGVASLILWALILVVCAKYLRRWSSCSRGAGATGPRLAGQEAMASAWPRAFRRSSTIR
mgnify:CR=1 FL=1